MPSITLAFQFFFRNTADSHRIDPISREFAFDFSEDKSRGSNPGIGYIFHILCGPVDKTKGFRSYRRGSNPGIGYIFKTFYTGNYNNKST